MPKITIISFHEHRLSSWVQEGFDLYLKRISYWAQCEHLMLKPSNYKERPLAQEQDWKLYHEHKILKDALVFICDEKGSQKSSLAWGKLGSGWLEDKKSQIVFVIGPTYGLDRRWHTPRSTLISFSQMTLPHELALIVLSEQIYRAFTIAQKIPYHLD